MSVLSKKRIKEIDKRVTEAELEAFPEERFLEESRALIDEVKRLKALLGWKKKRRLSRPEYLRLARDLEDIRNHNIDDGLKIEITLELAALALRNEAK